MAPPGAHTVLTRSEKGDKSDLQNYRKVSLIPSLAKVFESVLENRLTFKNLVCLAGLGRVLDKSTRVQVQVLEKMTSTSTSTSTGFSKVLEYKYKYF